MDKILFVDDEPDVEVLMKQRFRRQIRKGVFELYFAKSGVEALKILEETPDIYLVISDINMPEMDGLTLLKHINDKHPNVIPIIVSAYGDMNNIRSAMNLGAFDFVTKPINFDDLNITIDKTLLHIQHLLSSEKNKNQLDSILHDLDVASKIQKSILPRNFIDNETLRNYGSMKTAKEVGGDFYDFFWLDQEEKKLAVVMADVSGKGIPAAMFMTVSRTLIRAHAFDHSPAQCLTQVNKLLEKENTNMMFVTTFFGVLDTQSGEFTFCNAGHNPPVMAHSDGSIDWLKEKHGIPLGVMADQEYSEDTIKLNPKDLLLLYTDGVTEAENKDGECFGEEPLLKLVDEIRDLKVNELIETINDKIKEFAGDHPQSDDITMLGVRYLSPNE